MAIPGKYAKQPVDRVGAEYQGALVGPILVEMDRELRRLRDRTGPDPAPGNPGGGGGGASAGESYVTIANTSGLSQERRLAGTSRISLTDGGPGGALTVDAVGAALTRVDDTNVTLALGGAPATALVNAASLTVGWTGQLARGRGGTGLSATTVVDLFNQLDPLTTAGDMLTHDGVNSARLAIGSARQVLRSSGTAPIWAFDTYVERAVQNLATAGATIVVDDGNPVTPLTSSGNFTLTSVPTIANGRDGQVAILINAGASSITLQDIGTLGGSNLRLGAATRTLSALRGVLEMVYDSTMSGWIEKSFTNVLTFTPSVSSLTIDGSAGPTREVAAASTADAVPSFVVGYVGVPSAASIDIVGGEIVGSDYPINLVSPFTALNSGTSPPSKAFNRGSSVGATSVFTVTATVSGTAGLTRAVTVTYQNRRYAGPNSQSTLLSSAQVLALDGAGGTSDISNSQYGSFVVSTAAGEFIWFAHRSALTAVVPASGQFQVTSELAGFTDMGTISHTNDFGFVETFRLYRSTNTNFGSSKTMTTSSSRGTNRIYMGPSTNGTDTITTAQILALDDTASGTSRLGATVGASYVVTIGASNFLWFCHPVAIPDLTTIIDQSTGFAVAGAYRNNVSHTNDMGFIETYRCWRSDNPNIFPSGQTVVVT